MKLISCVAALGAVALLGPALLQGAAAEDAATAKAALKDAKGQDVGVASFTQTPAGVLIRLSVRSMPGGEHAFHIHAVGKCEPPDFASASGHFNPTNAHHGMMSGPGHAGDMPNLHIPADGSLDVEVLNTAVTLDKDKPNSVFHPDGTTVVIHAGKG
jgi:superoxide dismutase, Cu-Zn family